MNNLDNMQDMPAPELTPEQAQEAEAAQKAQDEATFGPMRRAAQQRQQNAAIVAEHDELLADMLYELILQQFGMEV